MKSSKVYEQHPQSIYTEMHSYIYLKYWDETNKKEEEEEEKKKETITVDKPKDEPEKNEENLSFDLDLFIQIHTYV